MFETILDWLHDKWPTLTWAAVLIFVTVFVTLKIVKYNNRIKDLEKTCQDVPGLSSTLNEIKSDLSKLLVFLTTKHTDLNSGFFQSRSPIQLTPIGHEVLDKTGGKEYVEKHLDDLIAKMKSQDFKSALDVQSYATSLVIQAFNTDDFIHIRNYLFQNPVYRTVDKEIPLNPADLYQIIGIFLRDKYFEKFPALKDVE